MDKWGLAANTFKNFKSGGVYFATNFSMTVMVSSRSRILCWAAALSRIYASPGR
jgi:hypothetical protein